MSVETLGKYSAFCDGPSENSHNSGSFVEKIRLGFIGHSLSVWMQRATTRRHLSRLDSRMIRDIGLNVGDAQQESAKPFWIK